MHSAEFVKMPQSKHEDGVAEYTIDNGSNSKKMKNHSSSHCCDTWCANSKHPEGFCCMPCCYRQNCVMMNGVFLCFSIIICISVLIGLAVTSGKPHIKTLFFVEDQCTTLRANLTGGEETCTCGGRFCHATFPCLEIIVSYKGEDGKIVESILHENEQVYTYTPHCSYQPENCIQSQNNWYVNYYKDQWGVPGLTFPCLHDPSGGPAIRERTKSVSYTMHMLLWPSVCSGISILLALVVYCHCCPRCYNE